MAPVFRATLVIFALLLFAPHLAARWRYDVRHDLVPPAPSTPVFISDVTPPQAVEVVVPERPAGTQVTGAVSLSFCVNRDGKVAHVAVTRSLSPQLDELAAQALRAWRFTPAQRDGKAEHARVEVTFHFTDRGIEVSARHAGADIAVPTATRTLSPRASKSAAPALLDREASMLPAPW